MMMTRADRKEDNCASVVHDVVSVEVVVFVAVVVDCCSFGDWRPYDVTRPENQRVLRLWRSSSARRASVNSFGRLSFVYAHSATPSGVLRASTGRKTDRQTQSDRWISKQTDGQRDRRTDEADALWQTHRQDKYQETETLTRVEIELTCGWWKWNTDILKSKDGGRERHTEIETGKAEKNTGRRTDR